MPDLAWWLQNFKESAFRLETLPAYSVPQEAEMLAAFMRGEPVKLPDDHPWSKLVSSKCGSGKRMQRVRVISRPLSDYERFELSLYRHSVAAGEIVRLVERRSIQVDHDFWLFDDYIVIVLDYDSEGRFLGTREIPRPHEYRRIRDLALSRSMEMSDYTARTR